MSASRVDKKQTKMTGEDIYIKNIEDAIRAIRLGKKTPQESGIGRNLNKLKEVNIGLYEDKLEKYKKVLSDYKEKNNETK